MSSVDLFDSRDSADSEPLLTLLGQHVIKPSLAAQPPYQPSPDLIAAMGPASPLDSPDDLFPPSQEAPDPFVPSKLPPVLDDVPSAAINNMRHSSASPSSDSLAKSSSSKGKSTTPSKGRRKNGNK